MKLHIKKDGIIKDIQKQFTEFFPYLKIDLFEFPHANKKMSPRKERIDQNMRINQFVKWDGDKVIEINEKMTVSQFETIMAQAGLFVQVSRKSGRIWIETSHTDDWTLEQQNEEGRLMSTIHDVTSKQGDWDDWDDQ